jgi:hypothetical protein
MTANSDFEEHDYTLLQADTARRRTASRANFALKAGAGLLLAGAGVGLAAYGISYAIEPRIIETTKVVTETKVERVEIEKPIVTEKVVTVDRPVVTEKLVQAPAAPPPPLPQKPIEAGQHMSREDFQDSDFFKNSSQCKGTLLSHVNGVMVFQNGTKCRDADSNGNLDPSLTTARHNGDLVSCGPNGRTFPNGKPIWSCFALHNGKIESARTDPSVTARRSQPAQQNDDPFAGLFE